MIRRIGRDIAKILRRNFVFSNYINTLVV